MGTKKREFKKFEGHLEKKLKNRRFKQAYELESVSVALAQKIAEIREDEDLTQANLAKRMGVTQQFVSQIETGEAKNLSIETLIKLCNSLEKHIVIEFVDITRKNESEPLAKVI